MFYVHPDKGSLWTSEDVNALVTVYSGGQGGGTVALMKRCSWRGTEASQRCVTIATSRLNARRLAVESMHILLRLYKLIQHAVSGFSEVKVVFLLSETVGTITLLTEYTTHCCVLDHSRCKEQLLLLLYPLKKKGSIRKIPLVEWGSRGKWST